MKRKKRSSNYLSYIWVFALGLTVLYSFSLLPRATGFVTDPASSACSSYIGDAVCDDTRQDCGPAYKEGISTEVCDECQSGGFNCEKYKG